MAVLTKVVPENTAAVPEAVELVLWGILRAAELQCLAEAAAVVAAVSQPHQLFSSRPGEVPAINMPPVKVEQLARAVVLHPPEETVPMEMQKWPVPEEAAAGHLLQPIQVVQKGETAGRSAVVVVAAVPAQTPDRVELEETAGEAKFACTHIFKTKMRSHFVLTFCLLVFASCSNGPKPPPPSNVPSAAPLKTASDEQQQIASSAIAAARDVNQKNPAGPAKDAVEGELSVAAASLPVAERKYRDEAFKRINAALVGKPGEAEKLWNVARLDAGILSKRVADLEVQVDSEREAAAKELQRQLDAKDAEIKAANDEAKHAADAKLNFWLQIGCFGLGALSLAGAAATLWVAGPVMAFLGPALGANVTQLLAFIGAGLISLGLLIRAVDHFVAAHPYLFFCGIGAVAIAAIYATALVHGNIHSHVTNPPQATPATFK